MIKYPVGSLLAKPVGSRESFDFNEALTFEESDGCILLGKVTGHAQCLKLPHELNVHVRTVRAQAQAWCSRCLKTYVIDMVIPFMEREFIVDLPERDLEVGEDVFQVDKGRNEIMLDEMLRQEILLHFPGVPVCSNSCQGLCGRCGVNLNESRCGCVHEKKESQPLRVIHNS